MKTFFHKESLCKIDNFCTKVKKIYTKKNKSKKKLLTKVQGKYIINYLINNIKKRKTKLPTKSKVRGISDRKYNNINC